jgi:hypothetical protein
LGQARVRHILISLQRLEQGLAVDGRRRRFGPHAVRIGHRRFVVHIRFLACL